MRVPLLARLAPAFLTAALAAPAAAEAPRVVTSILPLQSLTANVMRGVGSPDLLVKGAATPHSFQLRPSDAVNLQNADLVIWVGEGLESFLEAPLASLAGDARVLELAEIKGISLLPIREELMWHLEEHGLNHGDEHEEGHSEDTDHGHDHGAYDPHIWLDAGNAIATVEATALNRMKAPDAMPGDLGFDPLKLYTGKDSAVQRDLELKELNNGRLAMIAITWYAAEEFLTKASVVNDTPFLFKSIL